MSVRPDASPAVWILAPGSDPEDAPAACGCLVADDLVLTSAIPDLPDDGYRVTFGPGPQVYSGRLVVRSHDDTTGMNAGLLRIEDPGWAPPADRQPPRWGTFTGGLAWSAARVHADVAHPVDVSPLSWRRRARWDLRHGPSAGHGGDGAPLFIGDLLIGVAIGEGEGDARRWTAVPVAELVRLAEFRAPIEDRVGRPLHLEPIECAGLLAPWAPVAGCRIAADLLDPRRAVAPFVGQGDALRRLLAWCHRGEALAGLLLTGAPGRGKTRLARQAADRLYALNWLVGEVAATTVTDAWLRHLAALDRPALLIFDGMGSLDIAAAVVDHLAAEPPRHPVRLLVTAVAGDERWTAWRERPGAIPSVFGAAALVLPEFSLGTDEAETEVATTRFGSAFARSLERLVGAADLERRLAKPETRAAPTWVADGSPSTVAVAMLATLLSDEPLAGSAEAEEVLLADAVSRWRSESEALDDGQARRLAQPALDLALVTRPADQAEAVEVLTALAGAGGPAAALAAWIRRLHPPAEPDQRYWGALLPPSLRARRLAVACGEAEFSAALRRLGAERLTYALARLAEAADNHSAPAALLRDVLGDDPAGLGTAAVVAVSVTEAPAPLVAVLRDVASRDDLPTEAAATLADAIPAPAGALCEVEVLLRARITDEHRRAGEGGQRQAWSRLATELVSLSRALAAVDRHAEARAAASEAVDRHRALCDTTPGPAVVRGLRTALRVLGERELALGDMEGATKAALEATGVCRAAAATDRRFSPWLAADLEFLAVLRLDGGDPEGAVEAYEEAAREHRSGDTVDLDAAGAVLCGLSDALATCGRPGAAAAAMAEAAGLYEGLAGADPRAYLRPFAAALEVCAGRLAEAGRGGEAAQAAERAVFAYRRLDEQRHDATSTDCAEALRRLSDRYAAIGRGPDALAAAHESVSKHRAATTAAKQMVSAPLCLALHTLARRYDEAGQVDYAADASMEAAQGYRRLVERGQQEYRAALAGALSNAAVLRGRQGVPQESEPLARQALEAADQLDPATIAGIRNNLAIVLGEAADRTGATRLVDESAALAARAVRDLGEAGQSGHVALARALITLAHREAAAGRSAESIAAAEGAVEACDTTDPEQVVLAAALRTLAEQYVDAERFSEGAPAAERARTVYRQLVRMGRAESRADLAALAMLQASMPTDVLSPLAAAAAAEEAVLCYSALAAESPERYRDALLAALDLSAHLHASMEGYEQRAEERLAEAINLGDTLVDNAPRDHAAGQSARLRWLAERLLPTDRAGALAAAEQAFALSQEVRDLASTRLELAASAVLLARLLPRDDPSGDGARPMRLTNAAVVWFEELARERPDLHLADLATVLMFRAYLRAQVGNDRGCAADADLALRYHRDVAANVAAHRPALAEALLARLELPADGRLDRLTLLREVTAVYEELSQDDPDEYLPSLARLHLRLAAELQPNEKKATPESLLHRRQGIDILADLAERGRLELGPEAVRELLRLGTLLARAGRDVEAQGVRGRASRLNDRLGAGGGGTDDEQET
ncbi:hypothetical protein GCM10023170_022840 [Phytohabitans houttuyneae]|uniref:Uncharacterized protein n=1 Tax=Phytohabitans houttuyneae TaxID=1076126 RepID=A0A6V8KL49_9ACTN|nr:hypothetical protein Phou_087640 [Phytohabitans houttuyneae]